MQKAALSVEGCVSFNQCLDQNSRETEIQRCQWSTKQSSYEPERSPGKKKFKHQFAFRCSLIVQSSRENFLIGVFGKKFEANRKEF